MLDEKELEQVRNYVHQILPQAIRQEPDIAIALEGLLAQHFPRRDEFARLLDKLDQNQAETNRRFEEMDRRFEQQREEMNRRFEQVDQRLEQQREEMNRRFEQVDQRLEQQREEMNRRFEQVDQRLEQVDQRFEQVDQRFEQVDQRFEQVDQRFEQVDQRFEQVDQRFEQVDQRFEQVDQRFEQVDQRFEQVDQRLSKLGQDVLDVKRDVAQLRSGQDLLFRKLDQRDAELLLKYGDLGNIKGKALEDMFAAALGYGLRNPDIQPDQIKMRQPIADPEGQIFKPGYVSEIDLIAQNGRLILFEVKASAVVDHVDLFASKVDLIKLQQPDQIIHAVFISLDAVQAVSERCQALGVELVDSLEDNLSSV